VLLQVLDAPPKAISMPTGEMPMELELPMPVSSSTAVAAGADERHGMEQQSATAADWQSNGPQRPPTAAREHVMHTGGAAGQEDAQTGEPVVQQAIAVGS
jgi:hypothetical protein